MLGVPPVAASWLMVVPFVAGLGRGVPFPGLVGLRALAAPRGARLIREPSCHRNVHGGCPRPGLPGTSGGGRQGPAHGGLKQLGSAHRRRGTGGHEQPQPDAVVGCRVTDRPDARHGGAEVLADDDPAAGGGGEPGRGGQLVAGDALLGEDHEVTVHAGAVLEDDARRRQGGPGGGGNDGGGTHGGADRADAAGPEHGLALAGGVVDRGIAQAAGGTFHRCLGGGGTGGDDELVVVELHAVGGGHAAVFRVDIAGRLAEANGYLGQDGELQQFLGGVVPVAEDRDGAGERGPGELPDERLGGP